MAISPFIHQLTTQPSYLLFFAILGLISLTKLTFNTIHNLYAFFVRPPKDLIRTYGSWAIVTGATDGIGKSMAFELAGRGLNLVLLSRNPNKLQQVSDEICGAFPKVNVKTVAADLRDDIVGGARRLGDAMKGLDVGLLVNNAGIVEPTVSFFHDMDIEVRMKLVKVNLEALTEITRAVVPLMLNRGRGAIVNIGSGSTVVIPSYPLFSVYSGTKEYVNQLSKCLYWEYKDKGIDVQCQAPLYVITKMTKRALKTKWYSSLLEPSPDTYARYAVDWIGYESLCVPYFPHFLQWCIASFVPDFIHYRMRLRASIKMGKRLRKVR